MQHSSIDVLAKVFRYMAELRYEPQDKHSTTALVSLLTQHQEDLFITRPSLLAHLLRDMGYLKALKSQVPLPWLKTASLVR